MQEFLLEKIYNVKEIRQIQGSLKAELFQSPRSLLIQLWEF